ncbi:MAG: 23S rRNA (pseudouridine(1915)-N(3))-methyltransferase RlmH, partial [Anaeroplasmataceae bacterium]|nr:23S rRNA (pseudouridine(1915)-N(3))-methyltransferase RlmH [Anaeroplasmataceae bacterium]
LLKLLPKDGYKIALNLKGEMLSSPELAKKISSILDYKSSHIVFVIGGSLGLGTAVLEEMDYHLCFSKMTFPHQLMQVILLEQIYRSFKIIHNETYHK